jgi:hypothetical protein
MPRTDLISDTQSDALPTFFSSENPTSAGIQGCHSVANRTGRDVCDMCGSSTWDAAHFSQGKVLCSECWAGREPPVAMPPNDNERRQLALWLQPQTQVLKGTEHANR